MAVQLDYNTFIINPGTNRAFILTERSSPFARFCLRGETLVATAGDIAKRYQGPIVGNSSTAGASAGDGGVASWGENDEDCDSDVASTERGMKSMQMQDMPVRTMDERAQDRVASTGAAAVRGTEMGSVRERGKSETFGEVDGATYSVDTDATAHSVTIDAGAGIIANAVQSMPGTSLEQNWLQVDKTELWNAYAVFRAVHDIEGGLLDAISQGTVTIPPGADAPKHVDEWHETYGTRLTALHSATTCLINVLHVNRSRLGDPEIQRELVSLLHFVFESRDALAPRV